MSTKDPELGATMYAGAPPDHDWMNPDPRAPVFVTGPDGVAGTVVGPPALIPQPSIDQMTTHQKRAMMKSLIAAMSVEDLERFVAIMAATIAVGS